MDACLNLINLYKNEFTFTVSNFDKLFSLFQLVNNQILILEKIANSPYELSKLTAIRNQFESLAVLVFMEDTVEKLEFYATKAMISPDLVNKFWQENKSSYLKLFKTTVDFRSRATLLCFHSFVSDVSQKLSSYFKEFQNLMSKINKSLNGFYVDVVSSLSLKNDFKSASNNETIETILNVITSKDQDIRLEIEYRTLLFQLVFKTCEKEIVVNYLKKWFSSELFIGGDKNGIDVSVMFMSCLNEQLGQETSELSNENLVTRALKYSSDLVEHKATFGKMFETHKKLGVTFDMNQLELIAKFKFTSGLLVRFVHSSHFFEMFRVMPGFDGFNENMKKLVTSMYDEHRTPTLANFLIKEFVRKHGSSSLNFIMSCEQLKWITPKSLVGEERVSYCYR